VKSCIYLRKEIVTLKFYKSNYIIGDPHKILYTKLIQNRLAKETKSFKHLQTVINELLGEVKSTMEYSGNEWFDSTDFIQTLYLKASRFYARSMEHTCLQHL